jgi:uncharacterized membrane protein YdbT with pleckstrin-like domain
MATDYTSRLRAIPLFASLKEAELDYINSIVTSASYSTDQVIFTVGEKSDKLCIINTGLVRVRRRDLSGAETITRFLGPGQSIGEVGLLRGEPRNATVEAVVDTTLFTINKDDFEAMLDRLPGVKKQLEAAARPRELALRRFDWQEPDEVAVWVAHRNVIPLIGESVVGLIIAHGIAVLAVVLAFYLRQQRVLSTGQWGLLIGAVVWFTLTWAWYIVDWTNDYLVVTNRRVVHVERYGLIRETLEEIPVDAVQDVAISRRGPLAAVLGLANITVASIGGTLNFTHTGDTKNIQELILDQRTRVQHEMRREEREAIRQELAQVLRPASLAQPPEPKPIPPSDQAAATAPGSEVAPRRTWREWLRKLRPQMLLEKPGEITWRKHWLVLIKRLLAPIVLSLAGLGIVSALSLGPAWVERIFQYPLPVALAVLFFIAVMAIWSSWEYGVWAGDIYTVSTNRIVDTERLPLGLREKRRESTLDRIQDINVTIPNLLARVFDMGDVVIKTAAGGGDFVFRSVAHPHSVQRNIFHRLAEFRRREQEQQRRQRFEEMTKWLSVYNELTTPSQAETEERESG